MPSLVDHQSQDVVKLLLIGDNGAGKTGSLVSLVEAGYNIRVMDFDKGLDIVRNVLIKKGRSDLLEKVNYESLDDDLGFIGTQIKPKSAKAFQRGMQLLDNWPPYGPLSKWTPQDVLVIDSLSLLSEAALRQVLALNGRLQSRPEIQDWGQAQEAIQNVLAMVTSAYTKCNVVVMAHVTYIDTQEGVSKGYPNSLGKALSPKIGNYFNTVLLAKQVGTGTSAKRVIRTVPDGTIGIKHSNPGSVPAEMSIETGLATFFAAAKSQPQSTLPPKTPTASPAVPTVK